MMPLIRIAFVLAVALFFASCGSETEGELPKDLDKDLEVIGLKTEKLADPIGIDTSTPRFGWVLRAAERGSNQTAYEILVASSPEKLELGEADLWNSGKVESASNIHIKYAGKQLSSKDKCWWKVRCWTGSSASEWSEPAFFSVGLLNYKDWWGRWIGFRNPFPWESVEKYPTLGARYLRTEFEPKKEIKSATANIIGLGLYEMYLNGEKVGNAELAPVPTDYTQNVKINTYDVTDYLKGGAKNAIGVKLGNGRYFTMRPVYKPYKIKEFGMPKLLFHMDIEYADGSKDVVWSSDKWKGTADGPIRNNNEYDGEYYDARKEFPGWTKTGFDDSDWLDVDYMTEPGGDYEPQMTGNMKVMREVVPVSITKQAPGKYIMDMGQNMTGWVQMKVNGRKGQKVQLRFAESLEENGALFTTNLRDARVTDTYVLKGGGEEVWEPSFTYHGFRYVEITGYPGVPETDDFVGKMIYDDMETVGTFESSDSTLNQIFENSWWGIASNYKGMPVDCPQRNERQPWLADHAVGAKGENFIFDNARLYTKWLDDIRNAQKADGSLPDVAPAYWNYYSDNMTWPGTYLIIADMIYQQTGDVQVIEDNYNAMKKWLTYMKSRYMTEDYIVTKDSYGDWCKPPPTIEAGRGKNADVKEPSKLIASAYYYHFMNMMSDFALAIDREADIPAYQQLKDSIGEAFNQKFYHEEGYYGGNKMTDQILPLYFGVVTPENETKVFENLVRIIDEENNGHLSTGLVGTQWLMRTLTKYGRSDLAYQLATNRTYPSWGYMLENGATTIWELWHGNVANPKMNSQNHVMLLGDLLVWYYENLAGIKALEPGFQRIEMKPEFVEGLDYVNASHQSIMGEIKSHWQKKADELIWKITIPVNVSAYVHFPTSSPGKVSEKSGEQGYRYLENRDGQAAFEVGSGEYEFRVEIQPVTPKERETEKSPD